MANPTPRANSTSAGMEMNLLDGVLVKQSGRTGEGDPSDCGGVILPSLNVRGAGIILGIPGLGRVKLAARPFKDASVCGWVRGHRLSFKLGGAEYAVWSESLILPEDPRRPGKGWNLYGKLEPDPELESDTSYYGSFGKDELR